MFLLHQRAELLGRLMNPIDQLPLAVGLAKFHLDAELLRQSFDLPVDLLQRQPPVDLRLSFAKEIEIQKAKVAEARAEADRYSGGLVQALAETSVATARNSLAMLEQQPALGAQVTEVFKHLENQRGEDVMVWKITRKWSIDYLKSVYDELGLTLDHWYFESQLIKKTKKIIDGLIKSGVVIQSQGAWIVDLQNESLGVNLLIKTDGTLLYNAKDLALALEKEKDYHSARSIYVVDARQSHALEQLFATLKRMKFQRELTHLSYEFVTLADGAMAARKGNVVRYETLRDEMIEKAKHETASRHTDWTSSQVDRVSRAIAFAGMRFSMLKQDVSKKIVFDLDEALSFDGFTGPYLLYTYARIHSILKKAGKVKRRCAAKTLTDSHSHALFFAIAQFPEKVFRSSQELQPAILAQYLFDLAKSFSQYYEHVPVLQAKADEIPERLALLSAVAQVLQNGLGLLGIATVEEM
jgi:arginyl-tRNA synthetase